jgi:adenylosuccinate synthase
MDVLLGESWGDEGKGKVFYELLCGALGAEYRACLRYNGGPNAGHSIWIGKKKYVTRQIPTGILKPGIKNLVGRGVRISFIEMKSEIENLMSLGVVIDQRNLFIDKFAHVILPTHVLLDNITEDAAGYHRIGYKLCPFGYGLSYRVSPAPR